MASGGGEAVYTLTNAASGNAVAVFGRAADGSLTPDGTVPTGGLGTGAGLGSQGAIVLDRGRLFAVNAGDDTVSMLRAGHRGRVWLEDVAPSGGVGPISVTAHGRVVYVVNAGDASTPANISGVPSSWVSSCRSGVEPAPKLRDAGPGPDRVQPQRPPARRHRKGHEPDRHVPVDGNGHASGPNAQPSAGMTPFGFAFDRRSRLIVSEAFGGAPDASVLSSYSLRATGRSRRSRPTWPRPRRPPAGSS